MRRQTPWPGTGFSSLLGSSCLSSESSGQTSLDPGRTVKAIADADCVSLDGAAHQVESVLSAGRCERSTLRVWGFLLGPIAV